MELPAETNIMTTKSGLIPTNINEAMQLSEILAKSDIIPNDFKGKPSNIFVAVNWGIEIGLSPMQSLQSIAVINGRPSIWGDSALALVRGSGKLEYIKETQTDFEANCILKRKNEPEVQYKFSIKDAEKAGLISRSSVWKAYPKRMMQMRARSFALRDTFTDVLKGIGIAEEVQDSEDLTTHGIKVPQKQEPMAEPIDPLSAPKEDYTEAEIEVDVTLDDVKALYMDATAEHKAKMGDIFQKRGDWRAMMDKGEIKSLYDEVKAVKDGMGN